MYYAIFLFAGVMFGYSIGCLVGLSIGRQQGRNRTSRPALSTKES